MVEVLQQKSKTKLIIVNLHSPCAHNETKLKFFESIKRVIDEIATRHNDTNVIILGDFNTTFKWMERNGTSRLKAEITISKKIKQCFNELDLTDCWDLDNSNKMTWRHGEKMSRLDRIQWSHDVSHDMKLFIDTDWTYTQSDHCALIVKISHPTKLKYDRITRLDTLFLNNVILKQKFLNELTVRMKQADDTQMNPHQKLEYLKMSIRSIALEIASNYKKEKAAEMNTLREEINFWQSSVENAASDTFRDLVISKLDESICKRDKILNERGEQLTNRLQTKWYQEGERGTKYFLNMQRSKSNKLEMMSLKSEGDIINEPDQIDSLVKSFYKKLYEKGDSNKLDNIDSFLANVPTLDESDILNINLPITKSDLLNTLKSCRDSSPGPDAIPYSIIKLTWQHFGPALIEAWNFSINTGKLTHSHEQSYLKLLPKEGKDLELLKNWRPITLSNCDFKIITKTLAGKLTNGLKSIITSCQTAYIKDRQITDNIHLLQYAVEKSVEMGSKAMIVSLDAEKAFDSIEHGYIRKLLTKIGLHDFIKTFDILYRNQQVSIQLNKHCAGTYQIRNGVKQGDALSCILFILGIEPLLRNIECDDLIEGIKIGGIFLPKIVSYADDVACIIKPGAPNLQRIFNHYQIMTDASGLKLNADKTEAISWMADNSTFDITYNKLPYTVSPLRNIKINGIQIGFNLDEVTKINFDKVHLAIERQLMAWSNRHLSLLAKILIYKTFGLSQILFIAATTLLTKTQETLLTNLIYKFIWNKDMGKNKAPDRIKRTTLNSEIDALGFGMVDFKDIIKGIRIKTILRLLTVSDHPLSSILKKSLNSSIVNMKVLTPIRPSIDVAVREMNKVWGNMICKGNKTDEDDLLKVVLNEYVGNLICRRYEKQRMVINIKHDRLIDILITNRSHPIIHKLEKRFKPILDNPPTKLESISSNYNLFPIKDYLMPTKKLTTKLIRSTIVESATHSPKMIVTPNPDVLTKLGNIIKKLTNTRLKSILLRSLHGDVYSGTRLKKFGLSESDSCPRCLEPETREHQLYECIYTKKLWLLTSKLTSIPTDNIDTVLGHNMLHDKTTITLHSEIISRLLAIDRPTMCQISLLRSVVNKLRIVEKGITKYQIKQMVNILDTF